MKAILVVDMPEIDKETKIGCRNCRYADCGSIGFFETYKCVLTEQCKNVYDMKCPLRPLPEKSDYLPKDDHAYSKAEIMAYTYGITVGRNEVIDEIMGETE